MGTLNDKPSDLLSPNGTPADCLNDSSVRHLMHLLDKTQEGCYCCEETFDLLDEYVERITSSEDAALLMPYVKRHLELCPDCHEAYQTLRNIVEADSSYAA